MSTAESDIITQAQELRRRLKKDPAYKEIQDVALQHISLGRVVIRVPPGMKAPPPKGWNSTGPEGWDLAKSFQYWGREGPKARFRVNIAIACGEISGLFVLDIDTEDSGMKVWKKCLEEYPEPNTFSVTTPRGGRHYYFKYTKRVMEFKSTCRCITYKGQKVGWDIRSNNTYIVSAPSTDKDGDIYEIRSAGIEVHTTPQWLVEILQNHKYS